MGGAGGAPGPVHRQGSLGEWLQSNSSLASPRLAATDGSFTPVGSPRRSPLAPPKLDLANKLAKQFGTPQLGASNRSAASWASSAASRSPSNQSESPSASSLNHTAPLTAVGSPSFKSFLQRRRADAGYAHARPHAVGPVLL